MNSAMKFEYRFSGMEMHRGRPFLNVGIHICVRGELLLAEGTI